MIRANALNSALPPSGAANDPHADLMKLAERAGDSPRLADALTSLLEITRGGLEPLLRDALTECERQLVRLAEKSTIHEQNVYFDSVRELKQRRPQIAPRFFDWLENSLARLGQGGEAARINERKAKYTLSLTDDGQLDEHTVLAEIASKVEARIREPLYALGQRLGVLAGTARIPADRMPLGPNNLTDAMRYAAAELTLPLSHRLVLYRCFERVAMMPVGTFYATLNGHLVQMRILPSLHMLAAAPEAGTRPPVSLNERREPAAKRPDAPAAVPTLASVSTLAPASAAPDGSGAFARLRDLLAACRRAERYLVTPAVLQDVLGGMQSRHASGNGEDSVLNGDRLRSEIFAALAERNTAGHVAHLEDDDGDTLDLIAMLFESLARHTRRGGITAWMLAKLQLPMLRLALRDKAFFAGGGHPARQLLSQAFDLGRFWIDEIETDRDPGLSEDLKRITQKVAYEYRDDPLVFVQAAEELSTHAQRLAQRAALAEKRQVEAAAGHDKLERARAAANAAIAERLARGKASDVVAMLLTRGWSDVLAMTLLREGDKSAAYAHRLHVVDVLTGAAPADADVREELSEGLTHIGLHESDVHAICRTLFGSDGSDDEDPMSQTELALKLKMKARLGGDDGAATAAAAAEAPLSAEEQSAYAALIASAPGTWYEFIVSEAGDAVRRKLAWFSPQTDRCLLLNPRGMPGESMSLRELARRIAAGKARAVAADDGSFADRVWTSMVEMLRTFSAAQHATVGPLPVPPPALEVSSEQEQKPSKARTLLLVDDEVNVQRALIRVLRHDGYRILTASSANEGLEMLRDNDVQVIVSDQRMPGLTGTEFLSKVKVTHPHTIRLLLSGFSDAAAITEAINRGAIYKFLTKPWDDADFRRQVSEAFEASVPR